MSRKDKKGRCLHTGEQQRQEDGKYLYRYTDLTGKRKTVYANDLPELRQKEKKIQNDLDDHILTDHSIRKMTLNDMFAQYMETKDLAKSTKVNYERTWANIVKDQIGSYRVIQLRKSQVMAFYGTLSRAGYSHNTIELIHTLLLPTVELAVDDDIIRKNPVRGALSSEYGSEAKERVVLSLDQQNRLMKFLEESNVYNTYIPMIIIMLELGLRCGELIGLTWSDLYMADRIVSINHQLIYKNYGDGCRFHVSKPKTDAGIRDIPLTAKTIQAFIDQKKLNLMLGRRSDIEIDDYSDFIFVTKNNRPYMPNAVNHLLYNIVDAFNKEEFARAKKERRKAELLPRISAHCLRHTACTNMARKGMNVKVLQYIMGHSNSSVTMDVYNHLNNEVDIKEEVLRCSGEHDKMPDFYTPNFEKKVQKRYISL